MYFYCIQIVKDVSSSWLVDRRVRKIKIYINQKVPEKNREGGDQNKTSTSIFLTF